MHSPSTETASLKDALQSTEAQGARLGPSEDRPPEAEHEMEPCSVQLQAEQADAVKLVISPANLLGRCSEEQAEKQAGSTPSAGVSSGTSTPVQSLPPPQESPAKQQPQQPTHSTSTESATGPLHGYVLVGYLITGSDACLVGVAIHAQEYRKAPV